MAAASGGGPVAGRRFPTGGNYVEALQHPTLCFRDPDLRYGAVQQSPVLGPRAISGNFASVFSVTAPSGRRYAVKCFTREIATQEARYEAISAHLANLDVAALSQPWPVGFEYLHDGVMVQGQWYPALKMTWVEGTGLIGWIDRHRRDPVALAGLAERFAALTADLETHRIAHGDLQHGNLLVAADGTFRLVDYDGMYVPALHGQSATENGHRNYQSPNRAAADFGPAMDRFSAWVIHLALTATATDPELWDQLHDEHGEFLIMSESDFRDPDTSFAWGILLGHPDPTLRDLAGRLKRHLRERPAAIPALPTKNGSIPAPRTSGGAGTAAGLPPWMTGRVPIPAAGTGTGTGPGASCSGTGGQPTSATTGPITTPVFAGRRLSDVAAAAFAVLVAATPLLLAALALLPAGPTLVAEAVALLGSYGTVECARRRRPESRTAADRIRTIGRKLDALQETAEAIRQLDRETETIDRADEQHKARTTKALRDLHTDQQRKESSIALTLRQETAGAQNRLGGLSARESALLGAAVDAQVETYTRVALRRVSIDDAKNLPNMGTKTVRALLDAGIRSAADFDHVTYSIGGSYNTVIAQFRLTGGRYIRVPGIGEARASTLEAWRQGLEARARAAAPKKLDPTVQARIRDGVAAERAGLERDVQRAEAKAAQSRTALAARIATERKRLTDVQEASRAAGVRTRADLQQRRRRFAGAAATLSHLETDLERERANVRARLGYRRYLAFVVRGG